MSHGVMRFWFLLNFIFISAFSYIRVRYQFPAFFQVVFQADENPPAQIFSEQLPNLIYKLNLMCEERSYQIVNISAVNPAAFCYY